MPSQISRAETAANYDRLSRWYDLLSAGSEGKYIALGLEKLDVKAGETVLEVGFGTGRAIIDLARAVGEKGRVVGVELSQGMTKVARGRVTESGLGSRVSLLLADARALPFAAESLDAVFMSFTLELFNPSDMASVLDECRRCLRPGGRLGMVTMAKVARPTIIQRAYEWAHEAFPRYIDCRPIDVRQAVQGAGLTVGATFRGSMWGLAVEILLASKT
ncbi:MAG: class I SAM-dependent methyltransferase [Dehalococcoidales bacterium]|nr:class I SAM-dependent methyltransferase [Dehalococcoidales bacterium]